MKKGLSPLFTAETNNSDDKEKMTVKYKIFFFSWKSISSLVNTSIQVEWNRAQFSAFLILLFCGSIRLRFAVVSKREACYIDGAKSVCLSISWKLCLVRVWWTHSSLMKNPWLYVLNWPWERVSLSFRTSETCLERRMVLFDLIFRIEIRDWRMYLVEDR